MNKKYYIINSTSDENNLIYFILYIVLFFVVIFIVYRLIFYFFFTEKFDLINNSDFNLKNKKISTEHILNELVNKNKELENITNTMQNVLEKQSNAIYISQHFNKVDSSSFNDELNYMLYDFANTKFPTIDFDGKKIINNNQELNVVLDEISKMKNIYKPGDIVLNNSTFDIAKNEICYRNNGKPFKPTKEFLSQYPNCMVCSIEDENNLYDSNGWKNTKTNINKVCLYNPSAESNSGIPNLDQCKKFCQI